MVTFASTRANPASRSQGGVFGEGALLAFGTNQHAERLHQRRQGTGLVVVQKLFSNQERASRGQALPDLPQQRANLFVWPVMQNAAEGENVRFGQRISKKVACKEGDGASWRPRSTYSRAVAMAAGKSNTAA